jgi:CheY-like chemotaxis protein
MTKPPPSPSDRHRELSAQTRQAVAALLDLLQRAEACGSEDERARLKAAVFHQARVLRAAAQGRVLIVVARERPEHAERLKRAFAHDPEVEVIVDRRRSDRRRSTARRPLDRRRQDRRQLPIDQELSEIGAALVQRSLPPPPVGPERPPLQPGAGSSAYRILLIDDDPAVVEMLQTFLEASTSAYVVDTALSGETGLAAAAARRPDVVLLDVRMPGLDGLQVLKRIRALDPTIPVIMVTGASFTETSQALKSGAFAYIAKPFELRYIDHLVKLATEQAPASRR